jgi:hypothetical protein
MTKSELVPVDPQAALLAVAEEQLRWTRAASIPQVRQTIDSTLGLTRQRKAFELCDGVRTSTEIAAATKVPKTTLSGWTREWRNLGIANEIATAKGSRIQHLISLAALELPLAVKES